MRFSPNMPANVCPQIFLIVRKFRKICVHVRRLTHNTNFLLNYFFVDHKVDELNNLYKIALERALVLGKEATEAERDALKATKANLFKIISSSNISDSLPILLAIIARCKNGNLVIF